VTKKHKVEDANTEPALAGIVAIVQASNDIPDRCRDMLVAMVAPSLSKPKTERHAMHTLGVSMIEETLQATRSKLSQAVEQEQQRLSEIETSKASLEESLKLVEANLVSKESLEQAAQVAFDIATTATKDCQDQLLEAKGEVRKNEDQVSKLIAEKSMFKMLLQDHYTEPMQRDEGPHFIQFEPHIQKLGLDESLLIALPCICTKSKEQRGGFDNVVLGELEKAVCEKIELLGKDIEDEEPKLAECRTALLVKEADLDGKITSQKAAANDLEEAKTAREKSEAEVVTTKKDVAEVGPAIQEAVKKHEEALLELKSFETGPLASFILFRDGSPENPLTEEAAAAGA
jgi:hypothetical protein